MESLLQQQTIQMWGMLTEILPAAHTGGRHCFQVDKFSAILEFPFHAYM